MTSASKQMILFLIRDRIIVENSASDTVILLMKHEPRARVCTRINPRKWADWRQLNLTENQLNRADVSLFPADYLFVSLS